jgi:hypothetical protein
MLYTSANIFIGGSLFSSLHPHTPYGQNDRRMLGEDTVLGGRGGLCSCKTM